MRCAATALAALFLVQGAQAEESRSANVSVVKEALAICAASLVSADAAEREAGKRGFSTEDNAATLIFTKGSEADALNSALVEVKKAGEATAAPSCHFGYDGIDALPNEALLELTRSLGFVASAQGGQTWTRIASGHTATATIRSRRPDCPPDVEERAKAFSANEAMQKLFRGFCSRQSVDFDLRISTGVR